MYALLVGQGWVSPGEFWRMAPGEVWWLIDAKTPKGAKVEDVEDLYQALMAAKAEEAAKDGDDCR